MDTGADRDRFIDLLRGGSIVAVVLGHWLVADVTWADRAVHETSALREVPSMWPLTWLLVVIPVFFFVGGFANRRSWEGTVRRGEGYAAFVDRRVHRVLVPTGLYLAIVATTGLVVDWLGGLGIRALGGLFYQPLWFLGVYLLVVALVPMTLRAHRRFGWWVPVALVAAVGLGDLGRFWSGVPAAGYANVLLVWLLMHQLGYFCVDGTLDRPARRPTAMLAGGLLATALLVALGPYPATMVGVPGGEVGNMHPPTLAIVGIGFAQVGGAMAARVQLTRWLARQRVWAAVVAVNLCVVTIYLWHQPALAIAARAVLPFGYPNPGPGGPAWWVAHVLWLAVPGAVLAGIVALLGRAERVPPPPLARPGAATAISAVVGVLLIGVGFLALAGSSATQPFSPGQSLGPLAASPMLGLAAVAAAAILFRLGRIGGPASGSPAAGPRGSSRLGDGQDTGDGPGLSGTG